jgi:hypothetical protein
MPGTKPYAQRRVRACHDRSNRQSGVTVALAAAQDAGSISEAERLSGRLTMGANEPAAPASPLQVCGAGRVVRKKSLKLWEPGARRRRGRPARCPQCRRGLALLPFHPGRSGTPPCPKAIAGPIPQSRERPPRVWREVVCSPGERAGNYRAVLAKSKRHFRVMRHHRLFPPGSSCILPPKASRCAGAAVELGDQVSIHRWEKAPLRPHTWSVAAKVTRIAPLIGIDPRYDLPPPSNAVRKSVPFSCAAQLKPHIRWRGRDRPGCRRRCGRRGPRLYLPPQPFWASSKPSNRRPALAPERVSSRCG